MIIFHLLAYFVKFHGQKKWEPPGILHDQASEQQNNYLKYMYC